MTVNWFEGGRRISRLFMVLVAMGGGAYVFFGNEPTPTLTIRGPEMPWFVADEGCEYPSYHRALPKYDWGVGKPGLALCFLALENGEIPYAIAPTPPEERAKLVRQKAEDQSRSSLGEPPPFRLKSSWYYTDVSYGPRVQDYVERSVATLKITSELRQQLAGAGWRWRAHKRAFDEAAPWVFGLCIFIWLFTAVLGWIVRGFAGVPQSHDFRPRIKE